MEAAWVTSQMLALLLRFKVKHFACKLPKTPINSAQLFFQWKTFSQESCSALVDMRLINISSKRRLRLNSSRNFSFSGWFTKQLHIYFRSSPASAHRREDEKKLFCYRKIVWERAEKSFVLVLGNRRGNRLIFLPLMGWKFFFLFCFPPLIPSHFVPLMFRQSWKSFHHEILSLWFTFYSVVSRNWNAIKFHGSEEEADWRRLRNGL